MVAQIKPIAAAARTESAERRNCDGPADSIRSTSKSEVLSEWTSSEFFPVDVSLKSGRRNQRYFTKLGWFRLVSRLTLYCYIIDLPVSFTRVSNKKIMASYCSIVAWSRIAMC